MYDERWVRRIPAVTRLRIVGAFCLMLGVIGVAMFAFTGDIPNAVGSSCILVLGGVLLWMSFRRRDRPIR